MLADTVVVLDFETTGLSTQMDRATEVAAVMFRDGCIVDQYETLINAGVSISPMVTQLTGITTAMLRGAPRPEEVFGSLREFIGAVPVVAHNASFDYGVYRAELARAGLRREPEPFLCTKLLSRRVLPGRSSYSLSPLAAELNVRYRSAAHRALADAEVCAQVLHALCVRITELGIERVDVPLLQRLMRYTPVAKASTYLQSLATRRGRSYEFQHQSWRRSGRRLQSERRCRMAGAIAGLRPRAAPRLDRRRSSNPPESDRWPGLPSPSQR